MPISIQLPDLPDAERTPLVEQWVVLIEALAEENHRLAETVQPLRDEIAVLKGQKPTPTFKPSGMARRCDPEAPGDAADEPTGRRADSAQRHQTQDLIIHEDGPVPPSPPPPPNARFKGYRDFVVQDLPIQPHHIRYRLEGGRPPTGRGGAGNCRPCWKVGTSVPVCAPLCSTRTLTAPSPSRRYASHCANGASTSPSPSCARASRPSSPRRPPLVTLQTLKRLQAHQAEWLRVLLRPDLPLHTHGRENDIRGFVKGRKVSGGTRSDLRRRCRDTFASLKKTCRKLGISFWDYLNDRVGPVGAIPPLPEIVRERAAAAEAVP